MVRSKIKLNETSIEAKGPSIIPGIISLFSGCGGFDLGFAEAGYSVNLALDIDPIAVESYNHNHSSAVSKVMDLSTVEPERIIDLYQNGNKANWPSGIIGGSPCQTFSNGNVHFDENDPRHMLPRRYAGILSAINKKNGLDFFVFENVRGITSEKHQSEFVTIKRLFSRAGFIVFEGELDAADFGVAQHRRRIFLVGFNKVKYKDIEFEFPKPTTLTHLTVASKLRGLPHPVLFERGLTKEKIAHHPNHWAMFPKSKKFRNGSLKKGNKKGRSFRVLKWDKPSLTVAYGNREVHVHPNAKRRLSVFEAMLLQGFPENYELLGTLSDQIRQVSDAIPPQLGSALGKAIKDALTNFRNESCTKTVSHESGDM